jgi:hypothetical protein
VTPLPGGEVRWAAWVCAVCGAANESPVDPALGARQRFTEDCTTCCRPNLVSVTVRDDDDPEATAEFDE